MKVIYMGTPDVAVMPLLEIIKAGHEVALVVTQPDKKNSRRGNKVIFSPVKKCAIEHNIEVFQPNKVSDEEGFNYIKSLDTDIIVVCAYGQILRENILNVAKYGAINIHASLLPKYRGAAPLNRVIMNGEEKSGVTIMKMDAGLDTGDMILKEEIIIDNKMNVGILHDEVSRIGSTLVVKAMKQIEEGKAIFEKQDDSISSYASKILKEDLHIDFNKNAKDIYNLIRGTNPFPTAFCYLDEKNIKINESIIKNETSNKKCGTILNYDKKEKALLVACKDSIIGITVLKPEGKKQMDAASFYNGNKDIIGKILK